MTAPRVVLGVSGASGAALGLSVAHQLAGIGAEIDLVVSPAAKRTLAAECGPKAWDDLCERFHYEKFKLPAANITKLRKNIGACGRYDRRPLLYAHAGRDCTRHG